MAKKKKNKIMPMYIEHIVTPLLPRAVNLIFADNVLEGFKDKKGKWHESFYEYAESHCNGDTKEAELDLSRTTALVVLFHKNNYLYIILPKDANPGLIAHEVFHLALMICNYKGLTLTDSSEETYAYMIQWLMDEILEKQRLVHKYEKSCK